MLALEEVANETEERAKKHGAVYARAKLMERAGQITGVKISPVHEEEMRQARLANEAEGVFFPPDDPDKW